MGADNNRLTGKQLVAKSAAIFSVFVVSFIPFTTDVNLIVAPSAYSSLYFAVWAGAVALVYIRWRRNRMIREITMPLVVMFGLLAIGALFL